MTSISIRRCMIATRGDYKMKSEEQVVPDRLSETLANVSRIAGLSYIADFIGEANEADILTQIDATSWSTELERRVQHYGYRYDYKARRIDASMQLGELPVWLDTLCDQLVHDQVFVKKPDQVIINEYQPGQGISPHIDCQPCFDDTIASLSLGSGCVMDFEAKADRTKMSVYLEPRSLVVLQGDARYRWKHSIPKRIRDTYAGVAWERARRVSLTFRNVIRSAP